MDSGFDGRYGWGRTILLVPIRLACMSVRRSTRAWTWLIAICLAVHSLARAAERQVFHIEQGDASVTLNEFSRQSTVQLLFDFNLVQGRQTNALDGEFEIAEALRQMLADTGLVFDFVNDRTLAVTLAGLQRPGTAAANDPRGGPSRGRHKRRAGSADTRGKADSSGLEEVRITGTNVRGVVPIGEPVISLSREDIADNPAATVQDFLRTLPQTFGGGATEDTHFGAEARSNLSLGTGINLRGLGARATLVLINGHRLAPGGTDAGFVDVESVPLAAIERIEILPDSASALYGADAVGGVVNFVMRDNFAGIESTARIGSGTPHTLGERQAALLWGQSGDSGHALISFEYYRRDALPTSARAYATNNLTSLGGSNFDSLLSNPGNIVTADGRVFGIPSGQNGLGLTAAQLARTPNLTDQYVGNDLLPSNRKYSLYGSATRQLSDAVDVFANALLTRRRAAQVSGVIANGFAVTRANPFYVNPEGGTEPIEVDYSLLPDLGPQTATSTNTTTNVTLGMDAALANSWQLSGYASYAGETQAQAAGGLANFTALFAALADPNPATAFNPFGDGSHTNPATLAGIRSVDHFHMRSVLKSIDLSADGPVGISLPGGEVKLAAGVDHREQRLEVHNAAALLTPLLHIDVSRHVSSVFGELTVPIFGADNHRAGLRRLELSFSGRYEHFSDFGGATAPKYGLVWSPFAAIALRGTWGRSIRGPTLADLNQSQNYIVPTTFADAANPRNLTLVETGNNPQLRAERARSWSAGADFNLEQLISGLSASLTYFNIDFRDRIEVPAISQDVLTQPAFAELITRNPTPEQVAATCRSGLYLPLTRGTCAAFPAVAILDIRSRNLAAVQTDGLDLKGSFAAALAPGLLKIELTGTYLFHFTQFATPGSPPAQLLSTQNNPINLKAVGTINWQQQHFGATLGVNFQNHYTDTASSPERNIRAFTTLDAQIRYEFGPYMDSWLRNVRIDLNAINVFNVSPPFLNNAVARLGYDQENADPLGRLLSLQIHKSW